MMVFKKAIPRRTFLRGVGTTVALPFLDGMLPAFASANAPLRMGFYYVPNGINMGQWTPTKEGAGLELTPTLQTLAPFRSRLIVLSGLDANQANALPGEGGAFHTRTTSAYLTGVHPKLTKGADIQLGVSVDQIAAKGLGKQTQLASLELALDGGDPAGICEGELTCAYANLSWRSSTTPLPSENRPRAVFERLFGDSETTDSATRRAQIRENRSILDSVTEEVGHLKTRLHSKDRAKLGEYLDAVRDTERRIQIAEEQASRELPTLTRPGGSIPAEFEEYAKLMFDLQVLAFQTDMTRVSTFMLAHESSVRTYPEIGVPEAHHAVSHHRGDITLMEKKAKIDAYHVKLFAYFLEKLRSTADGDGSLLDHSMMVYGAGMSDGNMHLNQDLPVVLAGGAGGKLTGDRHVRFAKGTPITNLYLAMLDILGVPVDHLGDSTGKIKLLSV
jgi:Protein of unknown function (DUF1552)